MGDIPDDATTTVTLGVGQTLESDISSDSDIDMVRIQLVAGKAYDFNLYGLSSDTSLTLIDPGLALLDSNMAVLAFRDDGGDGFDSHISFTANQTGTYYLGALGLSGAGTYRLAMDYAPITVDDFQQGTGTAATLAVGATVAGTIDFAGDEDWFRISLSAGRTYTFSMKGVAGGREALPDSVLTLYGSDGVAVASNDDANAQTHDSLITFTPTTGGTYYLGGAGFSVKEGSYTISAAAVATGSGGSTPASPTKPVSSSVLVDKTFYYAHNPDVAQAGTNAVDHYDTTGWLQGRDPDALFSTTGYLSTNTDVKAANVNPLQHYDTFGWKEGRDPSAAFDTTLYLLHNPDVAAAGIDPLLHYLQFGQSEGRAIYAAIGKTIQADGFDAEYYLLANPDVAAAGVDPYQHYLTFGWKEGRNPNAWFDDAGYLKAYADVAAAGVNPLDHYHDYGWKEGRDPSAAFDTKAYLAANADVAAAHMDPLLHYLDYGAYELRSTYADGVFGSP